MNKKFEIIFPFEKNLNNDIDTYENLINLYNVLNNTVQKKVLLDFTNINFISANLLAVLGCCLDTAIKEREHKIAIKNLHPDIKNIMRKNGFHKYFSWNSLQDRFHSTMDYASFEPTTEHLIDFEHYLVSNIFSRKNLPSMNFAYKNSIIDNLLEMFNNVIDHANSSSVYVCGQFFPKNANLCFSIVDIGKTIHENVTSFLENNGTDLPENSLEWAIIPGNSTKAIEAPGGLGFSTLLDFIKLNEGSFILISDKERYEIKSCIEKFDKFVIPFPGTIVTVTINLQDNQFYILDKDNNNLIIF